MGSFSPTAQTPYYVAFSHITGVGPLTFRKLLTVFKTPQRAYHAPNTQLSSYMTKSALQNLCQFRSRHTPYSIFKHVLQKNIQILTPDMPEWPKKLRTIRDSPLCLYIKGNAALIKEKSPPVPSLAIIGSRHATLYGRSVTAQFASKLASAGIIIISGLAAGIDAQAHTSCLDSSGKTIAVLGGGIDTIYPRQNKSLYERILQNNGAIISEFYPGQHVQKGHFVIRNRLISGLSDGILIIEGDSRSGTLATIKHAGDQGKPIFGIPYSLNSPYSFAPNHAIRVGGTLATTPQDIFSWLHNDISPTPTPLLDLLPQEHAIFFEVQKEPGSPDQLSERLDISITDTLILLTQLELKGYVAKNSQGAYHITT